MLNYQIKKFSELSLEELYTLLKLRAEVFVVEQDCPYQDLDGQDRFAHHLLGWNSKNELAAYVRILPPGTSYPASASIGRVVTSAEARGGGHGKQLMVVGIRHCKSLYPEKPIKISAQVYLLRFYQSLGFKEIGEGYLEDGIPHIGMILINISHLNAF